MSVFTPQPTPQPTPNPTPNPTPQSASVAPTILDCTTPCAQASDESDYRGTVSVTQTGATCQAWTSQYPASHSVTPANYPDGGLSDHNYCRNPDGMAGAWCYRADGDPSDVGQPDRWDYCDVPQCNPICYEPTPQPTPQPTGEFGGTCLGDFVDYDFSIGGISQNNLGGVQGDCKAAGVSGTVPCTAEGQVLRFTGIATYQGKTIDLIVSNRSLYEPTPTCDSCNGESNGFAKVNVRVGTSVVLGWDFVDPDDGDAPVTLDSFYFTLFDFDTMNSGRPEALCIDDEAHGVTSYFAASGDDAEVAITDQSTLCDGATAGSSVLFTSTGVGSGCDNPEDPMELVEISCDDCTNAGECPVQSPESPSATNL